MRIKHKSWYPWLVVALLWGVALLNYLDRQMLSTMKPAIMADIHELEKAENFGRLMAIFLWIYGLMSPVAGLIADRINRKWLIVSSLGVWSGVSSPRSEPNYAVPSDSAHPGVMHDDAIRGGVDSTFTLR